MQRLRNSEATLQKLVGDNKKALLITNARDYYEPERRAAKVKERLKLLEDAGMDVKELDLRPFFSKSPHELEKFINQYDPGLIFSIGGNVFLLATALALSGMDEIIHRRLTLGISVYGGYSAGSMVSAEDLSLYDADGDKISVVKDIYGVEPILNGLSLIPEYIIPHVDRPDQEQIVHSRQERIAEAGAESILLKDNEVCVVDGERQWVE